MFIVNQDRNEIVNADNVTHIFIENGKRIMAETTAANCITLGVYEEVNDRAYDVFNKMIDAMFIPNMIAVNKNVDDDFADKFRDHGNKPWGIILKGDEYLMPYQRDVYYMPE